MLILIKWHLLSKLTRGWTNKIVKLLKPLNMHISSALYLDMQYLLTVEPSRGERERASDSEGVIEMRSLFSVDTAQRKRETSTSPPTFSWFFKQTPHPAFAPLPARSFPLLFVILYWVIHAQTPYPHLLLFPDSLVTSLPAHPSIRPPLWACPLPWSRIGGLIRFLRPFRSLRCSWSRPSKWWSLDRSHRGRWFHPHPFPFSPSICLFCASWWIFFQFTHRLRFVWFVGGYNVVYWC